MNLLELTDHKVQGIYYCAPIGQGGATLFVHCIGGPKEFRRIWLDKPEEQPDWTWAVPDSAVRLDVLE